MGLARFPLPDFRGGINYKDSPLGLWPEECQDALNMTLTRRGILATRAGKVRFDSSGFPAAKRAEWMRQWNFASTKLLMLSIDGTVYSCTTGGALTSRFVGTAGRHWCFEQGQDSTNADRMWFMNGQDNPKKFDGTTVSDWANTPPNGTIIKMWKNRMIVAGVAATPQRLFFSDIANPESPSASYGNNWVDIKTSEDDLDPITWLDVLGDVLLVFKKRSVFAVYDPTTFANRRLGEPGCEGRFMSANLEGRCYFWAINGLWSITPTSPPRFEGDNMEPYITTNFNFGSISRVRVVASRDRRIFVAIPTGASSGNNRVLELVPDMTMRIQSTRRYQTVASWMVHDWAVESFVNFRPVNTDVLLAGASDTNKLHTLFSGTNDDGVAINSFWLSRWFGIQEEEPFERLRRVNVEMTGRCAVSVYADFDSDNPKFAGNITSPVDADPLWDGGQWDGGVWDPSKSTILGRIRPEARGRYHCLRIVNNTLNQGLSVYAIEVAYRGGKEHS